MKVLIVVDMQNDFCTGKLANPHAVKIIPFIKNIIENGTFDKIYFTRDTHGNDYLKTLEGKNLPIEHCIFGTDGWQIVPELKPNLDDKRINVINKCFFGYPNWNRYIHPNDNVYVCGTVTSICVAANVAILKTIPEVNVYVLAEGCADIDIKKHEAALTVMEAQQAKIIRCLRIEVKDEDKAYRIGE